MERRVRRERGGGSVGVSIADFSGKRPKKSTALMRKVGVSLSIVREVWAFCDRPTFQDNALPPPLAGEFFKTRSGIRTCSFGHFSGDRFATHRLQNHCVLGTIWEPLGYSHFTTSEIEPHGIKRLSRGVRCPRDD